MVGIFAIMFTICVLETGTLPVLKKQSGLTLTPNSWFYRVSRICVDGLEYVVVKGNKGEDVEQVYERVPFLPKKCKCPQ